MISLFFRILCVSNDLQEIPQIRGFFTVLILHQINIFSTKSHIVLSLHFHTFLYHKEELCGPIEFQFQWWLRFCFPECNSCVCKIDSLISYVQNIPHFQTPTEHCQHQISGHVLNYLLPAPKIGRYRKYFILH